MKKIYLSNGGYTIVDDDMYDVLSKYKWKCQKGYATRNAYMGKNKEGEYIYKTISIHSIVLPGKKGFVTDHINRDRLDNRRSNLRLCTNSQNTFNQSPRKDNSTGVRGVFFDRRNNVYYSQITVNRKVYNLGNFKSLAEAYGAYITHSEHFFGEYSNV